MGGMRKIAAILVADIVGYSRLAGADEDRTLSRLRGLRSDLIDPAHHGRIVKRTGDGNSRAYTLSRLKRERPFMLAGCFRNISARGSSGWAA
jgi:class 3 adenylate cyclase